MQIICYAAFAEFIHAEQAVFAFLLLQYFHDTYTTRYQVPLCPYIFIVRAVLITY